MTISREAVALTGLCTTCEQSSRCALRATAYTAVWHCEEFDDRPRGGLAAPARPHVDLRLHDETPANGSGSLPRGICANCGVLSTCLLPRAEGGVFWCEEYA